MAPPRKDGDDDQDGGATPGTGERIAKVIARSGLCSRRDAEALVAQGRVDLDGRPVEEPGTKVLPGQRVTVDGEPLRALEPPRVWRFHKPRGLLTTERDPQGRPTVYDRLPPDLPRVMPVGRLDLNSEGLLLLTNDGGLKRRLELPATGWLRRYRVRVYGRVDEKALASLAQGVTVDGVTYGSVQARLDNQAGGNAWLTFALREGKNREIRKLCDFLGYRVNRLLRVAYGPFQLGSLPEEEVEEVPAKVLREQLGGAYDEAAAASGTLPATGARKGRSTAPAAMAEAPPPRRKPPRKRSGTEPAERERRSGQVEGGRSGAPKQGAAKPSAAKPSGAKPSAAKASRPGRASRSESGESARVDQAPSGRTSRDRTPAGRAKSDDFKPVRRGGGVPKGIGKPAGKATQAKTAQAKTAQGKTAQAKTGASKAGPGGTRPGGTRPSGTRAGGGSPGKTGKPDARRRR